MGRRIVQLVSLLLITGSCVPLALALGQAPVPEPTPTPPVPATPQAAEDPLAPVEGAELPPVPALPAPREKDLLRDVIQGAAPTPKSAPKATPKAKILPGPKSLALPAAKGAAGSAKDPAAAAAPRDPQVKLAARDGETGDPAPTGGPVVVLPNTAHPAKDGEAPAVLPFPPGDAQAMPDVKTGGSAREADSAAALDAQLRQSQAPTGLPGETSPLPPALGAGGRPGALVANPNAGGDGLEAFVLPPDQLPLGRQAVGLTVEVISPKFLNLNQEAALKVVVKNTGSTDAKGVVVRDELPDGLQFTSSQPIAQQAGKLLVWRLGTVAASSERTILLRVVPKKVGAFEHAATVTMQAGGKARTLVREPKLKVEQTVSSAKILKGQQVEWRISVTNTGDGPAHRVVVQAKLSPGLRHESGEPNEQNLFEQELDLIEPGQRVSLDALVTDTTMGGDQMCTVLATSPDVTTALDEARNTTKVNVTEPRLKLTVVGPDKTLTNTEINYDISLINPGTATARKVRVLASLPVDGRLTAVPSGAQFDKASRKLVWNLPQLDPGEKMTYSFQVRTGAAGRYEVAAEGRGDGGLHDEGLKSTTVEGYADLDMEVTALRRVVAAGDMSTFQIRITNKGTKDATRLLLTGRLSNQLVAKGVNIENNGDVRFNENSGEIRFPTIDRLAPGKYTDVNVSVLALNKPGQASFHVELMHDDLENAKIEDTGNLRITPGRTAQK